MSSQCDRVLAASRSFRGVCSVDFMLPDVVDGGAPITRLAARIQDLEARGCEFEVIGWRSRTKVYRLVSGPALTGASEEPGGVGRNPSPLEPTSLAVPVSAGQLFEVEPEHREGAAIWGEAA